MWIKLISPRMSRRPMDTAWKTRMAPPLALLVLGALTPRRHRVTLEDENVERPRPAERPDLVGITVKADTFDRARVVARSYRARGIPVVLGGIHPTACPDECAPHADAVVVGEAEEIWPGLLEDAERRALRPRYRAERPAPPGLTPVPRWELARAHRYLFTNTLVAGRGCPWRCDFCYNSSPNLFPGHRVKPPGQVEAEIASLGVRHVMFIDDNFIGHPREARTLVRRLRALDLTWHAAVSADIGRHEGLIEEMAEAGCRSLFIGFETVNERSLAACHKTQNRAADYDAVIGRIHRAGIMVNASVVFGFDEDDAGVFDATVGWLERNRVATMTAHILTPYPGTRLHRQWLAEGRIIDRDLRRYNTAHAVFRPARMTPAELEAGYRRAYGRFYSWGSILRRLPEAPEPRAAYLQFNLLYRKFGRLTSLAGVALGMRPLARLAKRLAYPPRRREAAPAALAPTRVSAGTV